MKMFNLALFVFVVLLPHCFQQAKQIGRNRNTTVDEVFYNVGKLHPLTNIELSKVNRILNHGFQDVRDTLPLLDEELQKMRINIKNCSGGSKFKDNVIRIQALANVVKNYLSDSNEITKDILTKACKNYLKLNVANWIIREIKWENHVRPLTVDLHYMDYGEFMAWHELVVFSFIMASILDDVCLSVVHANDHHLNETLEIYRNSAINDLLQINDILAKEYKINNLGPHWMSKAITMVTKSLKKSNHLKNHEFMDQIYGKLAKKYSSRKWFVASWSSDKWFMEPDFSGIVCNSAFIPLQGNFGRSAFFASFKNEDLDSSEGYFDKCLIEYWREPRYCGYDCSCGQFVEQFQNCTKTIYAPKGLPHHGILCIERPNDLHLRGDRSMLNKVPGFKYQNVPLVKVKGGFKTARGRSGEHYTIKDVILTTWKCHE